MDIQALGFSGFFRQQSLDRQIPGCEPGRIVSEQKERYCLIAESGEYGASVSGAFRYTALGREDFPAVGDWVLLSAYDAGNAIIHAVLPRCSSIIRRNAGSRGEAQILAANVDAALIVQAANRDFSINRLERYIALCRSGSVEPIIVLSKVDLVDALVLESMLSGIADRLGALPVLTTSSVLDDGYGAIGARLESGKTYCLLGSSGVGKSTMVNALLNREAMKTGAIGEVSQRGKHVTSSRELFILDSGAMLIDNPGLREVGIVDEGGGVDATFSRIVELSALCRFRDCSHTAEAGCAVLGAIESGDLDPAELGNFRKLEKERTFFDASALERRQRDRAFGKMVATVKKQNKRDGS